MIEAGKESELCKWTFICHVWRYSICVCLANTTFNVMYTYYLLGPRLNRIGHVYDMITGDVHSWLLLPPQFFIGKA